MLITAAQIKSTCPQFPDSTIEIMEGDTMSSEGNESNKQATVRDLHVRG